MDKTTHINHTQSIILHEIVLYSTYSPLHLQCFTLCVKLKFSWGHVYLVPSPTKASLKGLLGLNIAVFSKALFHPMPALRTVWDSAILVHGILWTAAKSRFKYFTYSHWISQNKMLHDILICNLEFSVFASLLLTHNLIFSLFQQVSMFSF